MPDADAPTPPKRKSNKKKTAGGQSLWPLAIGATAVALPALAFAARVGRGAVRAHERHEYDQQQQRMGKSSAYLFGEKIASKSDFAKILDNVFDNKGAVRLPGDSRALTQALIAATVGGTIGGAKGYLDPGYTENLDDEGRVLSKKRNTPWRGALLGAGLGAGTGALANYATQTISRYNPEIDEFLFGKR